METIQHIKKKFALNEISKSAFIDEMATLHDVLFDFSRNLRDTEIEKIEILDGQVIMQSRATGFHAGGLQFISDELDRRTVTREAFNFGTYESADSEMMYELIPPGATVFDIGANIGWYCNHIAATKENCTVYGFEPIPATFGLLSKNTALNNLPNIHIHQVAFSDKAEELTFYYSPKQTGASSSKNITENEEMIKLQVMSTTVDDFVTANSPDRLNFIKCDVEGAELFVFKGALRTLEQYKPVVFSEMLRKWSAKFGYHPNDIIGLFASLGYACFYAEDKKLFRIPEVTADTVATNFFFLHPLKHAHYIESLTN